MPEKVVLSSWDRWEASSKPRIVEPHNCWLNRRDPLFNLRWLVLTSTTWRVKSRSCQWIPVGFIFCWKQPSRYLLRQQRPQPTYSWQLQMALFTIYSEIYQHWQREKVKTKTANVWKLEISLSCGEGGKVAEKRRGVGGGKQLSAEMCVFLKKKKIGEKCSKRHNTIW